MGTEDQAALAEIAESAKQSRNRRTLFNARLSLFEPDRLLACVEPRLRFLFSPFVVIPLLVAVVSMVGTVLMHLPSMYADLNGLWQTPARGVAAVAILWASLALHEFAHGLTCKHFGGQVPEIGVMWRFPLIAPYCKADDVILLHNRWHRVYTAFAGVFVGLVALLPLGVIRLVTDDGSPASRFAGAVLVLGTFTTVTNLVPFLQLDGYYMLNHTLRMANLRVDSYRFMAAYLRRVTGRAAIDPAGLPAVAYEPRARLAYAVYALSSVVFGAGLLVTLLVSWFLRIDDALGPWAAAAILLAEAAVLTTVALYFRNRFATRSAADSRTRG